MLNNKSVAFFESQFQRQVRDQEYALNPFEILALGYVKGSVLDLGCGLGNFSLEAGRGGYRVLAVDASPTAVAQSTKMRSVKGFRCEAASGHRKLDHRRVVRHHCRHRLADVFPSRDGA